MLAPSSNLPVKFPPAWYPIPAAPTIFVAASLGFVNKSPSAILAAIPIVPAARPKAAPPATLVNFLP